MQASSSPIAKKLLIKPGQRIALLQPPDGYLGQLGSLPDGARVVKALEPGLDVVQLFVRDRAAVDAHFEAAISAVKPDGLLWICYPKGGAKAGTDLNRDILWKLVEPRGWNAVSLVAIDDTWSAMRFRPADKVGT